MGTKLAKSEEKYPRISRADSPVAESFVLIRSFRPISPKTKTQTCTIDKCFESMPDENRMNGTLLTNTSENPKYVEPATDDEDKKEKQSAKKKEKIDMRSKAVVFGSGLLNLFLLALVIVTISYMMSEVPEAKRNVQMCLNCTNLRMHPNDDLSMYDINEDDICCVRRGGNYSSVVDKIVRKTLQEKLISESPKYKPLFCNRENRSTAVIKLVGKLEDISPAVTNGSRFPWLQWNTEMNNNAGLTADDTHITIGRTGIYQIYSQLVFHNSKYIGPSSSSIGPDPLFMHAIYKMSTPEDDQQILGGSYTYFEYQNGETEVTSYIGSPYQLRKGEKLGVRVHDVTQVVRSNVINFFGVYQIQ